MARVLLIGIDPDLLDFSGPNARPGMNADVVRAGIAHSVEALRQAGHDPHPLYIPTDPNDLAILTQTLRDAAYDCVTIGGGVHRPPENQILFQNVLNIIGQTSPTPRIALVTGPEQAAAAAIRVLATH